MAVITNNTAGIFDAVAHSVSSFFKGVGIFLEEFGRARAAKAMYNDLAYLNDAELDKMGLKRSDISRTVFAKVYDLR